MTAAPSTALGIATRFANRGWAPIPVPFRKKRPVLDGWQEKRLTLVDLPDHFNGEPQNIGVLLGEPSGWLVDVDLDHPLAVELADQFLPATPCVFGRKSSRASHRLYRLTSPTPCGRRPFKLSDGQAKRLGCKAMIVEFRCTGHQTVFPGSTHESGEPVEWEEDGEPLAIEPDDLLQAIERLYAAVLDRLGATPKTLGKELPKVSHGGRHEKYVRKAFDDEVARVAGAAEGGRNDTLNRAALALGSLVGAGVLDRQEVETALLAAAFQCGLGEREATATIRSGMTAGIAQPRQLPEPDARPNGSGNSLPKPNDRHNTTDLGNAKRFVAQHGDVVRYVHPWQSWLCWDGKRWAVDQTAAVERLAKETVKGIWREAADAQDSDDRKAAAKWAARSEARDRLLAMIALARSEPGVPILPEQLDQDAWLLNTPSGTVDLRTGAVREHRQSDLITKLTTASYDPDMGADGELWQAFIKRIFAENAELMGFVQRFAGYCLTGDVGEHVMAIAWGTGCNGKSTLLESMLHSLGPDYTLAAAEDLLMAHRRDSHPTALADLAGKRLVVATESDDNASLAENLIKRLTGGDSITARRMYQNHVTFRPTHKLWLLTNHRPRVRGQDYGLWRRLRLIPFGVTIPEGERDTALGERLKEQADGVLAWMIEGALMWQRDGLGDSTVVRKATDEYRAEEDTLGEWINECCFVSDDAAVRDRSATLYGSYKTWSEGRNEHPLNQHRWGRKMVDRGFVKYTNNGTWYRGVSVRAEG